jgi:hypothetical protein
MLIGRQSQLDFVDIKLKCVRLFDYRRKQAWPPVIRKGEEWDAKYEAALDTIRDNSDICHTVDEAVVWANEFIATIVRALLTRYGGGVLGAGAGPRRCHE